MSFSDDLAKFSIKVGEKSDLLVRDVVAYVITEIDARSPVGNPRLWKSPPPKGYIGGRFRGNWQLGVDVLPQSVLNRIDPDGSTTVSAAISEIPTDAAGKVYYYSNSLPYSQRLEHGHSSQAPRGIVGLTVIDARNYVDEAARKLP